MTLGLILGERILICPENICCCHLAEVNLKTNVLVY